MPLVPWRPKTGVKKLNLECWMGKFWYTVFILPERKQHFYYLPTVYSLVLPFATENSVNEGILGLAYRSLSADNVKVQYSDSGLPFCLNYSVRPSSFAHS